MHISEIQPGQYSRLEDLLVTYFSELDGDIPEYIIRSKLIDLIRRQTEYGIIHVALIWEQSDLLGFSIYQIDTPASDWCKRPGWGFIREFFISEAFRKREYGSALAAYTEQRLSELGAGDLYLTSDFDSFWKFCGYRPTGAYSSNELQIFEKTL